jgi:hypothetical protein
VDLPFTVEQFLDVFRQYNLAVWPMQIVLFIIALTAAVLIIRKKHFSGKAVPIILAFLWLWTGIVYHLLFFTSINGAAYAFGALFILQAILFLSAGLKHTLEFEFKPDAYGITGVTLIAFSLFIYPVLNYAFGHAFPASPTFGLPCPIVIFTFGALLMSKKIRWYLLIIPLIWSIIGVSAAMSLGIWEDTGLVIAGVVGTAMLLSREWRRKAAA